MTLRASRIELPDAIAAIEYYYQMGWTDGLPVIPPTEERVQEMLDMVDMSPDTVIGATAEADQLVKCDFVIAGVGD